jgi:hypothetical protein
MLRVGPPLLDHPGIIEQINGDTFGMEGLYGPTMPERLFLIEYPGSLYALYCHNGEHGLACFSSEGRAIMYMDHLVGRVPSGSNVVAMSLDDALDKAKQKGKPVVCIMLLDEIENPRKQYVV